MATDKGKTSNNESDEENADDIGVRVSPMINPQLLMYFNAYRKQFNYKGSNTALIRDLAKLYLYYLIEEGQLKVSSAILESQGVNTFNRLILRFLDDLLSSSQFSTDEDKEILQSLVQGELPIDLCPDYSSLSKEEMQVKIEELNALLIIHKVIGAVNFTDNKIDLSYVQKCIDLQNMLNKEIIGKKKDS